MHQNVGLIGFFQKGSKKVRQKAIEMPASGACMAMNAFDKAAFLAFREHVLKTKTAVIAAIEKMDKQGAIDNLITLSNLSAKAIYNKNLREIVLVDDAIIEIKEHIDRKLAAIKSQDRPFTDEESEYYMLIRLSLIPVCSMLSVLNTHTTTAIVEANEEIDDRIQELQRFLVEYETQILKV